MKGRELGGKYREDPVGSEGKSVSQRKSAKDGPTWTPTEARLREQLMRQFLQRDGSQGANEAYLTSPAWCRGCDGRRLATQDGLCDACR